jgi:predicted ester cyclase
MNRYAPNCALYFPSSSSKPTTRAADLQSTKRNWKALPDVHWKIEEMVAEGDMVATRFTSSGTPKEEWSGIPVSGKKFEIGGIFIVRVQNGKVIEQREDADLLGLFQQLGMELKSADKKK